MEFINNASIHDEATVELRKQCGKRATTMCYMLEEAQVAGAQGIEHARRALYRYGELAGKETKAAMKNPADMLEFATLFGQGLDRNIYEMETVRSDEDHLYIDFHYCPYVAQWLKIGRAPEEIDMLCDLAMEGDRAIGDCFEDFNFTLGKTIAQGHPVCQIRFDRLKKS
ncbi:L-2-amino-thiazoline-4-carboxylic acid hydrolase [Oscillospiraceae bacterium MB08-C2-2]|nr:L-2-amino-thiazoline-4-carboxylic acid hydrolase [Oscillospiraceae bacterium MB08-C2-2]